MAAPAANVVVTAVLEINEYPARNMIINNNNTTVKRRYLCLTWLKQQCKARDVGKYRVNAYTSKCVAMAQRQS